jgi:serine/threonine protein kinase
MNKVVFFWTFAIIARFGFNLSLVIKDWLTTSNEVWMIYPIIYSVAEWWPVLFLYYKLIFSEKNFTLDSKRQPVLTSPGIDVEKVNIYFGKRGNTLCAVKYTTVREIDMLQHLHHESIINYIDHEQIRRNGEHKLRVFLEFVPPIPSESSNLINFMKKNYESLGKLTKDISMPELVVIAVKIMEGISYLHEQSICHLDIKGDNILVMSGINNEIVVKIIDFEDAHRMGPDEMVTLTQASIQNRYPYPWVEEVLLHTKKFNGKRVDMYAFGKLMYVIFGGFTFLHQHVDKKKDWPPFTDVLHECVEELTSSGSMVNERDVKDIIEIYESCVHPEHSMRMTSRTALYRLKALHERVEERRNMSLLNIQQ